MQAAKYLYVLAAGSLIFIAYLFSVSSFLYALYAAIVSIAVIAHLFLVIYLISYLRRFHNEAWVSLGCPSLPTSAELSANPLPFVLSGILTMIFIFGAEYKSFNDNRLNRLIWLERFVILFGIVASIALSNTPPNWSHATKFIENMDGWAGGARV